MSEMTITEALAEIKTIGKRLEKKRQAVLQNLARDSRLKDPLADDKGETSEKYVAQERQSIEDLEKRVVLIRTAIQKKNLEATCTVGDNTMTIQEWLNFRKDIADGRRIFLTGIGRQISVIRENANRQGARVTGAGLAQVAVASGEKPPVEIVLHLDEKKLLADQEGLEQIMGELDGKLSLLNATTVISI